MYESDFYGGNKGVPVPPLSLTRTPDRPYERSQWQDNRSWYFTVVPEINKGLLHTIPIPIKSSCTLNQSSNYLGRVLTSTAMSQRKSGRGTLFIRSRTCDHLLISKGKQRQDKDKREFGAQVPAGSGFRILKSVGKRSVLRSNLGSRNDGCRTLPATMCKVDLEPYPVRL